MKALIQRVSHASVKVADSPIGAIDHGLLVLVGIEPTDDQETIGRMAHKLLNFRVFADTEGKMNLDVQQVKGGLLLVSQFTLAANTQKGLRPSFTSAASPALAEHRFNALVSAVTLTYSKVATGQFGADMSICLTNEGPATFLLEVQSRQG